MQGSDMPRNRGKLVAVLVPYEILPLHKAAVN